MPSELSGKTTGRIAAADALPASYERTMALSSSSSHKALMHFIRLGMRRDIVRKLPTRWRAQGWLADTPSSRQTIELLVRVINAQYGAGTCWLEEGSAIAM